MIGAKRLTDTSDQASLARPLHPDIFILDERFF
jgi:hypothetical protein